MTSDPDNIRDAKTGHVPPALLVQAGEAALGLGTADVAGFVVKGNWLVRVDAMPGLLGYHFRPVGQRIPGLYHTSTLGLYAHWLLGGGKWREDHAIAAPMMNNRRRTGRARAFYPDRRQSLKLATAGSDYAARMEREIEGRAQVAALGHLPAPRLHASGELDGPDALWLMEDMVTGRRLRLWRDKALVTGEILPALARQAQATALPPRPMADLLPEPAPDEPELVTRLRDENPLTFASLCHGDLTAANICVNGAGWTLLDWEWLGPGNPWADMLLLGFKRPARHRWLLGAIKAYAEQVDPAAEAGYIHGVALLVSPIWATRPALRPQITAFIDAALST